MTKKMCEVCSIEVSNLKRHLNSSKHKRFVEWSEYGNYGEKTWGEQNNILRKQLKEKQTNFFLSILMFFKLFFYSITGKISKT